MFFLQYVDYQIKKKLILDDHSISTNCTINYSKWPLFAYQLKYLLPLPLIDHSAHQSPARHIRHNVFDQFHSFSQCDNIFFANTISWFLQSRNLTITFWDLLCFRGYFAAHYFKKITDIEVDVLSLNPVRFISDIYMRAKCIQIIRMIRSSHISIVCVCAGRGGLTHGHTHRNTHTHTLHTATRFQFNWANISGRPNYGYTYRSRVCVCVVLVRCEEIASHGTHSIIWVSFQCYLEPVLYRIRVVRKRLNNITWYRNFNSLIVQSTLHVQIRICRIKKPTLFQVGSIKYWNIEHDPDSVLC